MGSGAGEKGRTARRPVLFPFLLSLFGLALSEQIRYRIPEEMPKGSAVGNLAKDLGFSVQELPTRKLRISSEKPYFTVSAESGELLVSGRLDREQICGKNPACALEFEVVAENPLNFYHVNVEIEDVNDHTPKFTQNSFELQISESTKPGARFILGSAHDADVGTNSLQNYQLSPNDHFSLVNKEKSDGSKYPELVLKTPLDREKQKTYHLTLTALDFGDPPLTSIAKIQVVVTDANDNPPVFSQDIYRVSLLESVYPGTTVLQVTATDQDEGINAEISFSFSEASQIPQFDLNSNTGEITILNSLDFEEIKQYSIVLEARDGGGMIAQCTVEIEVLDENDNVPEVIFQSLPDLIMEDIELGTHIALFKIRDKDSGHNGEVTCKLEGDVPFKILTSSRNTYKLVTDGVLDREQNPEYNVTITATDLGKPPLSSSSSVTLHVGDVNDNAPIFHQASYLVHVAENNPPGASIAQVSASDPDLCPNGHVSYAIVASDLEPRVLSSYVSVSAQSGVVFAQRAFDHEQLRAFELTLQARDQGSPALSANVSLRVLVGDRNDNAPRVLYPALGPDGSALFDTVPRAAEPGYLVCGDASGAMFPLCNSSELTSHPETLTPHCRRLVLLCTLLGTLWEARSSQIRYSVPEETEKGYILGNISRDLGLEARELAERGVRIISRTNDNAPIFAQSIYRVKVPENVPPGTQLLTVTATDPEEGVNGKGAYKFREINEKQSPIFQLNENTGEISTAKSLDYEECSFYEMEIQAEDGGGLKGRTKVLISMEDVNDNRPEMTITSLFSPVREDAPQGTPRGRPVIVLFNAREDSGKNGEVICSIQENLTFKLENPIEDCYGLLTTQILDREKASEYNITVTATDRGAPPLSTVIHIALQVADINDNPPAFSQASYSVYLPENNARGPSIFSVTAHVPDNENARVIYSLAEDTIQQAPLSACVSINSDTGMLYALCSFDYEQFHDLQIQVRARDSRHPPLSSNVSLSLFVLTQDDYVPEILYPTFPTDGSTSMDLVPHSAEPGYLVTKVVAVDRDSGQNAWLSYHLLKASEPGLFMVGLHTGEVCTAWALMDRDAPKRNLMVVTQDHGHPPLLTTVMLTVAVAGSIPDVLANMGSLEVPHDSDASGLTLYLVVAVTAISCVFLAFVIMLLALRLKCWNSSHLLQAAGSGLGVPTSHFVGVDGVWAFLQTCSHEVSLTADSLRSHLIFSQPNYAYTLISQESCEKSEPLCISVDSKFPIENTRLAPMSSVFLFFLSQLAFSLSICNEDSIG
ncbi:PREDICTED: LOW QUALITY PROTEIN: protocadherin gamma-B6-like [Galeopterus variegatus]|uniref:LOW QUALITY PROTEIN: protocadherin gamma-B6-like n=1 Tax=Galeopterus variegatus TaxID=482537 RepID=A0ABM0QH60_GALVR|nr:PREDICTED: LOW QUALITY PROTEIN: protocadherin gamma-B6-like [Galeopterus variegatus]